MTTTTTTLPAGLMIPGGFTHRFIREELHESVPVAVTRYQRTLGLAYGREHVTTVIGTDDGILYGYTRQIATADKSTVDETAMPDTETARKIAFEFLAATDSAYAAGLTVRWIDRHDEQSTTADGAPATVAGVKVKTGHENGLYAWVIVGEHGQVITYERDVSWNSAEDRRHTHMWLHDQWISAHDTGGPELDPPLARLVQAHPDSVTTPHVSLGS